MLFKLLIFIFQMFVVNARWCMCLCYSEGLLLLFKNSLYILTDMYGTQMLVLLVIMAASGSI